MFLKGNEIPKSQKAKFCPKSKNETLVTLVIYHFNEKPKGKGPKGVA